jgi:hypothetical protein
MRVRCSDVRHGNVADFNEGMAKVDRPGQAGSILGEEQLLGRIELILADNACRVKVVNTGS